MKAKSTVKRVIIGEYMDKFQILNYDIMTEQITETNICTNCGIEYPISPREQAMYISLKIPPTGQCPYCNLQQPFAFWPSVGKRYKRKCDFSGETIVTNYAPNARFPVYKFSYFESDKRDPASLEYNPQRLFFSQLKELQEKIPHPHML